MESNRQMNEQIVQGLIDLVKEMPKKLNDIKNQLNLLPTTEKVGEVTKKIDAIKRQTEDLWKLYHSNESVRFMLDITDVEDLSNLTELMKNINKKLDEREDKKFYATMWFRMGIQLIITAGAVIATLVASTSMIKGTVKKNMEVAMVECIKRIDSRIDEKIEIEVIKINK